VKKNQKRRRCERREKGVTEELGEGTQRKGKREKTAKERIRRRKRTVLCNEKDTFVGVRSRQKWGVDVRKEKSRKKY